MLDILMIPFLKEQMAFVMDGGVAYSVKTGEVFPAGLSQFSYRFGNGVMMSAGGGYVYSYPVGLFVFGRNGFTDTYGFCGAVGVAYENSELFYSGYGAVLFRVPVATPFYLYQIFDMTFPALFSSSPFYAHFGSTIAYPLLKIPVVMGLSAGAKVEPDSVPLWFVSLFMEYLVVSVPLVVGLEGNFEISESRLVAGGGLKVSYRGWQWGEVVNAPSVDVSVDYSKAFSWKEFPLKIKIGGDVASWSVNIEIENQTVLSKSGNGTFSGEIVFSVPARYMGKETIARVVVSAASSSGERTVKDFSFNLAYVGKNLLRLDYETLTSLSEGSPVLSFVVGKAGKKRVKIVAHWNSGKLEEVMRKAESLAEDLRKNLIRAGISKSAVSVKVLGPQKLPFEESDPKNRFVEIKLGG